MSARPVRPWRAALLIGACLGLAAPRPALAKKGKKAVKVAQKYIELGQDLFRLESYREAADNFLRAERTLEEGGRAVPAPLFRALARCHDQMGEADKAIAYYDKFLELATAKKRPKAKLKRAIKEARDSVGRLKGMLARTALDLKVTPAGVKVRIDGEGVGETPLEPVKTSPGLRRIVLSKEGYRTVKLEVEVVAGAKVPVVASLTREGGEAPDDEAPDGAQAEDDAGDEGEISEAPPGSKASEEGGGSTLPWVLAAGGVALLAGAVALTVMAGGQESDADDQAAKATEANKAQVEADVQEAYDSAGLKRNLALTLGTGALVAGGVATWLWLGSDASASGPSLSPAPVPGGWVVLLRL